MNRRRAIVVAALLAGAAAVIFAVADPFTGTPSKAAGVDNGAPTATARVTRQDLSAQTQVSATLGYADPSVIAVPAGTAPTSVQQAQQQSATAESQLQSAQAQLQSADATLAADQQALARARATHAADLRKLVVDCSGSGAAETSSGGGGGGNGNTGSSPCPADQQAATTDATAITAALQKVQADQSAVSTARTSLAGANRALAGANAALAMAQSSASTYGQTSVYTMLPPVGRVVRRGHALYAIGGQPVVLLYGAVAPWRAFSPGMSPGADVAELNANLGLAGDAFTSATESAIRSFQAAHGMDVTGQLLLGSVVFEPGAVRVTAVTPTVGAPVQAGPILNVTSTRRVVTIALDASQQTDIKVGDPVTITLPDNSTTPGRVSFVGTVATTPSSSNNGNSDQSTPTIEVDVTPVHPHATGRLDQAPVDVSITTASVKGVLVVPVNALLSLTDGGFAVEEVVAGVHKLVPVQVGLFDDALGLVQVSGPALHPGLRVVVPAT